MSGLAFTLNGTLVLADLSGALVWPDTATLAVADLHFEKGTSFARRGTLLPPYDTLATLERLERVIARHRPRRILCLGDAFHDGAAPGRLPDAAAARLRRLTRAHEWYWIAGNHDPVPPPGFGGNSTVDVTIGPLVFRHQASARCRPGEVSGHFHPKASLVVRGRYISRPCFVTDGRRLILPAFGAYTGGLDVTDPDIGCLMATPFTVHVLGHSRLHSVSSMRLLPPRRQSVAVAT